MFNLRSNTEDCDQDKEDDFFKEFTQLDNQLNENDLDLDLDNLINSNFLDNNNLEEAKEKEDDNENRKEENELNEEDLNNKNELNLNNNNNNNNVNKKKKKNLKANELNHQPFEEDDNQYLLNDQIILNSKVS